MLPISLEKSIVINQVLVYAREQPEMWSDFYSHVDDNTLAGAFTKAWQILSQKKPEARIEQLWALTQGIFPVVARTGANCACLALLAYDDASKYLEMSTEKLKIISTLSEHPAAILLLPAVIAFEKKIDNKSNSCYNTCIESIKGQKK
jgi:hypothetical protein